MLIDGQAECCPDCFRVAVRHSEQEAVRRGDGLPPERRRGEDRVQGQGRADFFSASLDKAVCRVGNSSCTGFGCFGGNSVTWPRFPALCVIASMPTGPPGAARQVLST